MDSQQSAQHSMDSWIPPEWVKVIISEIDQGHLERAHELMAADVIDRHVEATSMPEKGFLLVTLARLFRRLSRMDWAERLLKQLLDLAPGNVPVLNELANIQVNQGRINDAVKTLTQAKEFSPDEPAIWGNLGTNLVRLGQTSKGISLLKDAVAKMPDSNQLWSMLLLFMHYSEDIDRAEIFEMSRKWGQICAPGTAGREHRNTLDPDRKLRIGYISPDFRDHSVTFLFEPLLDAHNRECVALYGYGHVVIPDQVTERLKAKFDVYRPIHDLEPQTIADMVCDDEIDILVDLAGHIGGIGAYTMAHKPAPVQVTWLGYPDTTGLSQVDYRFTDSIADPDGAEAFHTESLFRLDDSFLCYGPGDVAPPVKPSPCVDKGHVTFGSFNNGAKLNPFMVKLWSQVLNATPGSKLLLKIKSGQDDEVRALFLKRFEAHGISSDRIILSGWLPSPGHLELYNQVDIALDTFPYNGTVTTLQAILMGVPVISLVGDHHMSRVGMSILSNLELEFFAAKTAEEYVAKAVGLASQTESLNKIRLSMRNRLASSVLCNNYGFARKVEQAYRTMWQDYCRQRAGQTKTMSSKIQPTQEDDRATTGAETPQTKAQRGILYVVWGQSPEIEDKLARAIKSAEYHHPELPIHVERLDTGSKITKTTMFEISPFEETLFLDNDTVVLGRLDYGFEKARQFGLACCINENPWARRFGDAKLSGDVVEYNSGVLFFTERAKAVFDTWHAIFSEVDSSLLHYQDKQLCRMPATDQASFALAIERTGFLPFVLPQNWNFRPQWYRSWFGPVKIWHDNMDVPESLVPWNQQQSDEKSVIQFAQIDMSQDGNMPSGEGAAKKKTSPHQ